VCALACLYVWRRPIIVGPYIFSCMISPMSQLDEEKQQMKMNRSKKRAEICGGKCS